MHSDSAIARVERILDLIPYLVGRETKLADLATHLGVSEEVVRRDLEIAFLCGLPGYTPDLLIDLDLGDESVTVLHPQSLEGPRRLSAEESSLLLFGLELLTINYAHSPTIFREIETLRSKFSTARLDSVVESIPDERAMGVRGTIEKALLGELDLTFDYVDSQGRRTIARHARPLNISWRGSEPILEAYDYEKKATRFFLLSRIYSLEVTDRQPIDITSEGSDTEQSHLATLTFKFLPRWWVKRNAPFVKTLSESGGRVSVEVEYWSRAWLVSAVATVADRFESLSDTTLSTNQFKELLLSHLSGGGESIEP